jgi:Putative MetA-pathway of phenol degradation
LPLTSATRFGPAGVLLAVFLIPARAEAQTPNPHDAQPERPTVGTHTATVAPGWIEIEAGFERQNTGALANSLSVPFVAKIGLAPQLQLNVAPGWQRDADNGQSENGMTDLLLALKWRFGEGLPIVGDLALQTAVSLPSGSEDAGRGTGSAGLNLIVISSHQLGPFALDVNIGYQRLGGDGTVAPENSTLWSVSTGFPIAGRLGWCAEVFGFPGTSGPAGTRPIVAFLTGPTLVVRGPFVVDAGAIFDITGFGRTAVFGGLTWNVGRLWRR